MSNDSSKIGDIRPVNKPFIVKIFDSTVFILIIMVGFLTISYFLFRYLPVFLPNYFSYPFDKDFIQVTANINNENLPTILLKRSQKLIKSEINYYIFNITEPKSKTEQTLRLICKFPREDNLSSISVLDTLYIHFPAFAKDNNFVVRIKVPDDIENVSNSFELKLDRLVYQDFKKWETIITENINYSVASIPYIFTIIWGIFSLIGFGEMLNIYQKFRKFIKSRK